MKAPKVVREHNRRERAQRELLLAAQLFATAEAETEEALTQDALPADGFEVSLEQLAAIERQAEASAMLVRCARRWAEVAPVRRRRRR